MTRESRWTTTPGLFPVLALALAAAGCGNDVAGVADGAASLVVGFGSGEPAASVAGRAAITTPGVAGEADAVTMEGENGRLILTGLWLVVDDFELARAGADCDGGQGGCRVFQAPPRLAEVPLGGASESEVAVREKIPAGSYGGMEFEVKGPEGDLLEEVRSRQGLEDWPETASVSVTGRFEPTGEAARSFRVFFRGEVEVGMTFPAPLAVEGGEERRVAVVVAPGRWLRGGDGRVPDLSLFDFEATGRVPKLTAEFLDAFTGIEFEGG